MFGGIIQLQCRFTPAALVCMLHCHRSSLLPLQTACAGAAAVLSAPLSLGTIGCEISPDAILAQVAAFGGVGVPGSVTALSADPGTRRVEWKAPARSAKPVARYEIEIARLGEVKQPAAAAAGESKADGKARAGKAGVSGAVVLPGSLAWSAVGTVNGRLPLPPHPGIALLPPRTSRRVVCAAWRAGRFHALRRACACCQRDRPRPVGDGAVRDRSSTAAG